MWGSVWLLLLDKQLAHHLHPNLPYRTIVRINPFVRRYAKKTPIPVARLYYNMIRSLRWGRHPGV